MGHSDNPGVQHSGFFQLRDAYDLLRKLEHDYERLRANRTDSYAAFDFFVTATHIPEWMKKVGWAWERPAGGIDAAIFKLCGDLGNGAKHFSMHQRVDQGHEVHEGPFDPAIFDPAIFDTDDLLSPNFGNQTCEVRLEDERRRPELLLQLASRHGTGTILDEQQKQLKCLR